MKLKMNNIKNILTTGSSHVNRILREYPGRACAGISGGDIDSAKEYFRKKSVHELALLERVILIFGGNDLCKKGPGGKQLPNKSAEAVCQGLQDLARFVLAWVPNAEVTTTDPLPRNTEGGFANARSRLISRHIVAQDQRHHHAPYIKNFLIISRVKASVTYRPKDLFYEGSDGVHLNATGYDALEMMVDWLVMGVRREGDRFDASVPGHSLSFNMKF